VSSIMIVKSRVITGALDDSKGKDSKKPHVTVQAATTILRRSLKSDCGFAAVIGVSA
jgi:hypothetical protein